MKIALLGELRHPIKENTLAGTEIWIYNFAQELIKRGHDVTLFASNESKYSGKLVRICSNKEINFSNDVLENKNRNIFFTVMQAIELVKKQNEFEIIHLNIYGVAYFLPFLKLIEKPVLSTAHGYFVHSKDYAKLIFNKFPEINYIFVSNNLLKRFPKPHRYHIILNGVDIKKFIFSEGSDNHYFWIGTICDNKGTEHTVQFANKSKVKLIISGPIQDENYYDSKIKPLLSDKIEYIGPLNFKEKMKQYTSARALMSTVNWEEPFGLTIIESMACGTPVIAYNRGAMSEIIIDGFNGYLVDPKLGVEGLIKAKQKLDKLSQSEYHQMRANCRKHVEENFTIEKMVNEYEKVYQKVINNWKTKKI